MTGPQHYQEAERLLKVVDSPAGERDLQGSAYLIARAQVHATLALTAASAYPAMLTYWGPDEGDTREWAGVLS